MAFHSPDPLILLLVFVAYFLIDVLYAAYTLAVVERRPLFSANLAALIYLLLAVGILNFTANAIYLVPMVIGSWLGTYLTVLWNRRGQDRDQTKNKEPSQS